MHEQNIIDDIIFRLDAGNCKIHVISLVCSEQALRKRLRKDVNAGTRTEDVIGRSIERISLYERLSSVKADVLEVDAEQVADFIVRGC